VLPPDLKIIGNCAFYECKELKHMRTPSGVTTIWDSAFSHCSSLTLVEVPPSVGVIGMWAFGSCSALTRVKTPLRIRTIPYSAFYGVTKLERLTLVGWQLSRNVVQSWEDCLMSTATVIGGGALVGEEVDRFTILSA
jgi:hypothetical protein